METNGSSKPHSAAKIKPTATSDSMEVPGRVGENLDRLLPWRTRFWNQFTVLAFKQLLVYTRNLRATILRLLAPLFFMFLLWLLNIAVEADSQAYSTFVNTPTPAVEQIVGITDCTTDTFMRTDPCWDFIYSPSNNSIATNIVDAMRNNNPSRAIPADRVLGFESIELANEFMAANPERVNGGVHFLLGANSVGAPGEGLDYVLQVNSTAKFFKDRFQDPTFFSAVPLQVNAEREMARYQWENSNVTAGRPFVFNVAVSQFAHPDVGDLNIVGQAMGPFVFAANMFNFVLLMSSVVAERERGLRQALRTSGMLDSAFWLSWAAVELLISTLFTLLLIGFGAMFQFQFFLNNSFAVVFLLFLLFQWAMVSVAFLVSTLIRRTSTAVNIGFVVFIFGWVLQSVIIFGFPYSPDYIDSVPALTAVVTLFPFAPLSKGALDLGLSGESTTAGISWSRRSEYCQNIQEPAAQDAKYATDPGQYWNFDCVFPIGSILTILAVEFFVYFLLAVYLDNVLPDENGVRKSLWFFLNPQYWVGKGGRGRGSAAVATPGGVRTLRPSVPCPVVATDGDGDADVAAEEEAMKDLKRRRSLAVGGEGDDDIAAADADNAVEVFGLQKAFDTSKFCGMCSKPGFWAIKGSWISIEKDRLFCLLGPNGAGKTTTINCLTGVLPPTGGDALVYGQSITAPGDMDRIRSTMGVCPQFDVLWGELTGAEHMYIYGRVKGLTRAEVTAQSNDLLGQLRLVTAEAQRTSAYSGGMRRRLSVAIALLGDPLIVYLDEPTTGMDPISRRQVWDAIEAAKKGRAVVLTTHSMEEADVLGDSIAIMARGRVRAFGSSLRLKQRFGSGYQLAVAVAGKGEKKEENVARVAAVFAEELQVTPEASNGAYLQFLVPKDREDRLPEFLQRLEARSEELAVTDVQIGLTSLEEVFLSIARKAELEAAAAEGRGTVSVTLEDGTILEVPLGEEVAHQASTGRSYAVKWAQNEQGSLQVLSWLELEADEAAAAAAGPSNGVPQ